MSKGRRRSFLEDLGERAIEAIDSALELSGRDNETPGGSTTQPDWGPRIEPLDPPAQAVEDVVTALHMPAIHERLVVATLVFAMVMLTLLYSIPMSAFLSGVFGTANIKQSPGSAPASGLMAMFTLSILVLPVLVAMLISHRLGNAIGEVLGSTRRIPNVFFMLAGVTGLGALFAAQFIQANTIQPIINVISSSTLSDLQMPWAGILIAAGLVVSISLLESCARSLLGWTGGSTLPEALAGFIPAVVSLAFFQFTSITLKDGLSLIVWGVYILAIGLMLSGFIALMFYRFREL